VLVVGDPRRERGRSAVVRMRLAGSNARAAPTGSGRLAGRTNYLRGGASRSPTGVPAFARVRYRGVWPGIDVLYHGRQGRLEYDFEVAPGADPGRIALDFSGQRTLTIGRDGDLLVRTAAGTIRQHKPVVYQRRAGRRQVIPARFVVRARGRVSFRLGAYDRSLPLVIDPVVVYSTYLGGTSGDEGAAIAADAGGNAYVTGLTWSPDFPAVSAVRGPPNRDFDAFVTKLDAAGTQIVYSTYLGGGEHDTAEDIAVDGAGAAYVTGRTSSPDFPTTSGAVDTTCGADGACDPTCSASGDFCNTPQDAFVAKLAPDGATLAYSTYLGGSRDDVANAIAVDSAGAALVAGSTTSSDFPVHDALQATPGGAGDGFVAKIDPAGAALGYSTYIGGDGADRIMGLGSDAAGNAYVAGATKSPGFPTTTGALDGTCGDDGACDGGSDAFLAKLAPAGTLSYATFLGTDEDEEAADIAVGRDGADAGRAYVLGSAGPGFQTTAGAYDRTSGEAFVARLDAAGSGLGYATFLGGLRLYAGNDRSQIAVDAAGDAYVGGLAGNANAAAPRRPVAPGGGAHALKLASDGSDLAWSTPLGGTTSGMAVDAAGAAYVTGTTSTTNFPTQSPLQPKRLGTDGFSLDEAFVVKLTEDDPAAPYVTGVSPSGDDEGGGRLVTITATNFGDAPTVAFGGVPATGVEVRSPTQITAIAPARAAGETRVTVSAAGRTSPPNPISRFVYAEGRWSLTAPLASPQSGTATLLENGKVLFVANPGQSSTVKASLFHPVGETWTPTASPPAYGSTTLLRSGKVLLIAGPVGGGTHGRAWLYDPAGETWTQAKGEPRTRGGDGLLLHDGNVLIVGSNTAELYDPVSDTFRVTGGPTNGSPTIALLRDGRVLTAGGDGGPLTPSGGSEIYDPSTGEFTPTGSLNIPRSAFSMTLLPSGKVLVAGGFAGGQYLASGEVYDPATGRWRLTPRLDTLRAYHAAVLLPNGRVLVAGGTSGGALDTAELYDPAAGTFGSFRVAGPMGAFLEFPTAVLLSSDPAECGSNCGKVLVVGSAETAAAALYSPRAPAVASTPPAPPPAAPRDPGPPPPPAPVAATVAPIPRFAGCPKTTIRVVRGTARRDTLRGSSRGDRVFALGGADSVTAQAGDDCIDLGAGNDRGAGGSGSDRLLGRAGRDRLTGGSGRDVFDGGTGDDRIEARDRLAERIVCGPGRDTVVADRSDRVSRDCERVRRR
jgi:hypothetical protein